MPCRRANPVQGVRQLDQTYDVVQQLCRVMTWEFDGYRDAT